MHGRLNTKSYSHLIHRYQFQRETQAMPCRPVNGLF
jgi:hypothetical protein